MIPGRFRIPLLAFFVMVVGGVVGYRLLEGWTWLESIWMVGITITTIGFGEIHPLSDRGRVFTLLLIGGGISLGSYTATELTRYVVEGELRRNLEARRFRRTMDTMRDHHVIIGYGRLGREVAQELRHAKQAVVVVESEDDNADRAEHDGYVVVRGDATSDATLRRAAIERARGVAIATSSNASNVFITLSARQLNPTCLVLTRVDDDEAARKALRAGANHVLSPQGLGGSHMAHAFLRPHARAFLDLAMSRDSRELEIGEVAFRGAPTTLAWLAARDRFGVLVVAVRKADGRLMTVPGPQDPLEDGDIAITVGRTEQIQHLQRFVDTRVKGGG